MDPNKTSLAGICGIYCGDCPSYLAPRQGDSARLEEMARDQGREVEEVVCQGCLSNRVAAACRGCAAGFRDCAAEKGVTWCFQCAEFPCDRLRDFIPVHVVNGIVHHRRIVENLEFMRESGVEAWVEREDAAGRCSHCGRRVYWSALNCPHCGSDLGRSVTKG